MHQEVCEYVQVLLEDEESIVYQGDREHTQALPEGEQNFAYWRDRDYMLKQPEGFIDSEFVMAIGGVHDLDYPLEAPARESPWPQDSPLPRTSASRTSAARPPSTAARSLGRSGALRLEPRRSCNP